MVGVGIISGQLNVAVAVWRVPSPGFFASTVMLAPPVPVSGDNPGSSPQIPCGGGADGKDAGHVRNPGHRG